MISLKADHLFSFFTEKRINPDHLWPEEKAISETFSEKRLEYFSTGRFCARQAMLKIMGREWPIGKMPSGAPLWPSGIVGSISHTEGLAGAIIASVDHYTSVGLDIESRRAVDRSLWDILFDDLEQQRLKASSNPDEMATLFFSMKEAYYKMQHPLTGSFLDFRDVRVEEGASGLRINRLKTLSEPAPEHQAGHLFCGNFVVSWVLAIR